MTIKESLKKFWEFLKEDTWQSWIVSLILMVVFIKLIFFPGLGLITGTSPPLLVVESCSMYHASDFSNWWFSNQALYGPKNISQSDFSNFNLKNGLNKGDIVLLVKEKEPKIGDVIIFRPNAGALASTPIIHRIIETNPVGTKGDNNKDQLSGNNALNIDETNISQNQIIGKAVFRIPYAGWIKLIFFEPFRSPGERGFCHSS